MNFETIKQTTNNKAVLYLMRHGQTIINKAGRVQGWCDGILTEEGVEIAENVALGLSDIEFTKVYSSDLRRAVKTAEIVIKNNKKNSNLKVQELEDLREEYFGKYEGELESIMHKAILDHLDVPSFKEAYTVPDFGRKFVDTCADLDETGQAENYEQLLTRIMRGFNFITQDFLSSGGGTGLVVVHGGILRHILAELDNKANVMDIANSSVSVVQFENGKYTILSVNDMSYMLKGAEIKEKELLTVN